MEKVVPEIPTIPLPDDRRKAAQEFLERFKSKRKPPQTYFEHQIRKPKPDPRLTTGRFRRPEGRRQEPLQNRNYDRECARRKAERERRHRVSREINIPEEVVAQKIVTAPEKTTQLFNNELSPPAAALVITDQETDDTISCYASVVGQD